MKYMNERDREQTQMTRDKLRTRLRVCTALAEDEKLLAVVETVLMSTRGRDPSVRTEQDAKLARALLKRRLAVFRALVDDAELRAMVERVLTTTKDDGEDVRITTFYETMTALESQLGPVRDVIGKHADA